MARLGREHGIRKRPFGSYRGSSKDLSIFESSFGSFLKPDYSQMWKGDVWGKLLPVEKRTRFYSGSVHEWMCDNLPNKLSLDLNGIDWACIFGMISWRI
ncbi:hypothetical protein J1N35_029894 [Gossypium stocksii]|uniref:Uncharacterized protein n=1 Tax=Gossypium stocksii TaxID=47602 RepID=A0A9D3UYM3_9ROSI|nr:hypothetical protein J1N35_029894 [Gossypium stocksii]